MIQNVNRPLFLFFRSILRLLLGSYFVLFKGFKIAGKKKFPGIGPAILIANHAAFIDSVYFICAMRRRFVVCGAKSKYFSSRKKRMLMALANIIRVESEDQYLADCKSLLDKNEILLIYPEMGRNKEEMGEFKDWAAKVALANNCPLTPCYIYGTTEGEEGSKKIIVGDTFNPGGSPESLTGIFRDKIIELKQSL